MLNKPYQKFHTVGENNYYILPTGTVPYLTIESVLKYKTPFLKRDRELTVAQKVIALNSAILQVLLETLKLNIIGESSKDEGLEKELTFEQLDVKKVRSNLNKLVKSLKNNVHQFAYDTQTHNKAVLALIAEGNALLCEEPIGKFMRRYYLVRSDKNGVVRIMDVLVAGKKLDSKLLSMTDFVLDRTIIENLVVQLEKKGRR